MSDAVLAAPSRPRLPADPLRSVAAVGVAALEIAGWVFFLSQPELRASAGSQGALWWTQQILLLGQTIFCLGIVFELPSAARGALLLTALALTLGIVGWVEAFRAGHLQVPVTGVANAILLWRLSMVRRTTPQR